MVDSLSSLRISVVICTFNGWSRGFLSQAINSVLGQTRKPDELIVIDDGSSDRTAELIAARYERVKVIWQENAGLPAARNLGLKHASGDLIAFLDDDDVWAVDKLQCQEDFYLEDPTRLSTTMSCCSARVIDSRSRPLSEMVPLQTFFSWPLVLLENPVTGPSGVVVPRNIVESIGPFNSTLTIGEDYEYWIRLIEHGFRIVVCGDRPLLDYRVHDSQMTAKFENNEVKKLAMLLAFTQKLSKRAKKHVLAYNLSGHIYRAFLRKRLPAKALIELIFQDNVSGHLFFWLTMRFFSVPLWFNRRLFSTWRRFEAAIFMRVSKS